MDEHPEALARWLGDQMGGPPVRFEQVEPGEEQALEHADQRDLDGVYSLLALRRED